MAMAWLVLVFPGFTGGVERGGDDDDARDEFNGDGQSDAEGHAIVAERGIGDGILVKTVNDRRQPDFQRYLLGCRRRKRMAAPAPIPPST